VSHGRSAENSFPDEAPDSPLASRPAFLRIVAKENLDEPEFYVVPWKLLQFVQLLITNDENGRTSLGIL
jgi:hypothetical protein